jgi:hypothetical protein
MFDIFYKPSFFADTKNRKLFAEFYSVVNIMAIIKILSVGKKFATEDNRNKNMRSSLVASFLRIIFFSSSRNWP